MVTLAPALGHAGAWTLQSGDYQLIQQLSYYTTGTYFNPNGKRLPQDRYTKLTHNILAEYGVRRGTTLGLTLGVAAIHTDALWNYGVNDMAAHARQRLWQSEASVLSGQISLGVPAQFSQTARQLAADDFSAESLEFRLLYGHNVPRADSLPSQPDFLNVELAHQWRGDGATNLIHADISYGYKLANRWMILPQIFASFGEGDNANLRFAQPSRYPYDLVKLQLSVVMPLTADTGLQIGAFHDVYSRNTGSGGGALVALWYQP